MPLSFTTSKTADSDRARPRARGRLPRSLIASAEFPAETAQDRETLTLRAVLLDGNGDVVNDTEQKLTVFQDVTVVPNDNVVILKLEPGLHTVAGETVTVKPCGMLPLHFVSRKTGHPAVDEFKEQDFSYWYDAKEDCITPLLDTTFTVEGFTPILLSNNMDEQGNGGQYWLRQKSYTRASTM